MTNKWTSTLIIQPTVAGATQTRRAAGKVVRSGQILDILKVDQLDLQIDVNVWNVEERGENEAKV